MDARSSAKALVSDVLSNPDPLAAFNELADIYTAHPEIRDVQHMEEIAPGVFKSNPGPDAATMAARWNTGVGGAADRWVQGMRSPRRDPKQAAIKANGKYKQRMAQALQQDQWLKGISGYDVGAAVETATSDGGSAYVAGAQKRLSKYERAAQILQPQLSALSQTVQNLPQDTPEQREHRMLTNLRGMRQIGIRNRGV